MIYTDCTIRMNGSGAVPDKDLFIFKGGQNISINFKIVNKSYNLTKADEDDILKRTGADSVIIKIKRHDGGYNGISEEIPVIDGVVTLELTQEIIECMLVGDYDYEFTLLDTESNSIMTLPPIKSLFHVKDKIFEHGHSLDTPASALNVALCNVSIAAFGLRDGIDESTVFDEEGNYNQTVWVDGDLITDVRLNKIEEAIYGVNDKIKNLDFSDLASKSDVNSKFDDVMINEEETTNSSTVLDFYGNGVKLKTIAFSNGNANGNAYISTSLDRTVDLEVGNDLTLPITFNSTNLGKGTLKITINNVLAKTAYIDQGQTETVIPTDAFKKGENRMVVYVTDDLGVMSNSLTFIIRYGALELTSSFNSDDAYDKGSAVRYYFTPTAIDTSAKLTFYITIDGVLQTGVACTSGVRGYFTFPQSLSIGAHYCEAWISDGTKTSNKLTFSLALIDNESIVIASNTKSAVIEEGDQLSLDYKIFKKNEDTFNITVYIDNIEVAKGTAGGSRAYYRTNSLTQGTHTIKIVAEDLLQTVSDDITWTITVTASTYELVQSIVSSGVFIASAMNLTNADENKEIWEGRNQDGDIVNAYLYDFSYNENNGWIDDSLIITGNSYVEIPIQPLANNARYGFSLDINFYTRAIGQEDAEVLRMWNDEKDCGILITTDQLLMRSASKNELNLFFSEEEFVNAIFIIDRDEKTAKIYLNGVMCGAFHLSDYSANGTNYLEDFTVNSDIILGGKNKNGYCRIKSLRLYEVALSTDEILTNFISCSTNKGEQKRLVEFQTGDSLPTLTVYCDFAGLGKDDKKPCNIVYNSTDERLYGKSFTLEGKTSQLQYQGTSSMAYPIKNYRLNLRDENGDKYYYDFPFGKPECRFTLKADFMSSGHWQNTGATKWINDNLYNYNEKDEKSMNPKKWYDLQNGGSINDTRECIYGFPCRLILVNDGNTALNEGQNEPTPGNTKDMGIFNFNHDKDATDTMGFDTDVFPNCASYEVTANSDTSAGAFMSLKQHYTLEFIDKDSFLESNPVNFLGEGTHIIDGTLPTIYTYNGGSQVSSNNYGQSNTFTTDSSISKLLIRFTDKTVSSFSIDGVIYDIVIVEKSNSSECDLLPPSGDELEYIKQSFELRFPDEDDVAEDWGFMGIPGEEGTGLKALIDWVDGCTDEEFVADFEEHFHKDYTLRYFLLVITLGMVDNLGKNMMLDTWDNKIFMPRFYDCDTICSYDNSGDIKFDVDIEMEQGYWNTSTSRLWTRVRDLMHDELIAKYADMRGHGLSYDNLMSYFYDEQIAKIPQRYYNNDADVKYLPFAEQYLGMAHGDGLQHLKRWLKRRIQFVDSLFDYAPSYNNDVITIRANTTEEMEITIETYNPVYLHMSWYNGQMDKKKIDGKTAVTFTGYAMAATDQEVLIYGGSNIKRISGLTSMNPNQIISGAATKLIELEVNDCPLLADFNLNGANLASHVYLNKLKITNCPNLGGALRLNNAEVIREIDMTGTSITDIQLASNIRSLESIKLPNTITTLSLNDASKLHTLYLEEGSHIESIRMTNCNNLVNVENFNLLECAKVYIDNAYNTVKEFYFNKAVDLTLRNLPGLERVIYTPNAEHEVFDKTNVDNALDYKLTTFNCPKLSTFMTTAPYRESYNNTSLEMAKVEEDIPFECTTDSGYWSDTGEYISGGQTYYHYIATISQGNDYVVIKTNSAGYCRVTFFNDTDFISRVLHNEAGKVQIPVPVGATKMIIVCDDEYIESCAILVDGLRKVYPDKIPNEVFIANSIDISSTQFTDVKLLCTTDTNVLKLPQTVKNLIIDSAYDLDTDVIEDGDYDTIHNELIQQYTEDWNEEVKIVRQLTKVITKDDLVRQEPSASTLWYASDIEIVPGTMFSLQASSTNNYTQLQGIASDGVTVSESYINYTTQIDEGVVLQYWPKSDVQYIRLRTMKDTGCEYTISYSAYKVPDIIPSASDGSLIFAMHAPSMTDEPDSGVWDMSGLDIESIHTFGLNNDIVQDSEGNITMPNRYDDYAYQLDNLRLQNEVLRYTASVENVFPTFIAEAEFQYNSIVTPKDGLYEHIITAKDSNNLPTRINFSDTAVRDYFITVDYIDTSNCNTMNSMFYGCSNLTSLDLSNFDTSNVTSMANMFYGCSNLTSLDLSNFDTSNVTSMENMFRNCNILTSLDVSSFVTTNVTSMSLMFYGCNKLSSLDLSSFDTTNVTAMNGMFQNCIKLTSLDLSNFNTSNVTTMTVMFNGCSALTSLDLSNFDTSNVTDIGSMFYGCSNLTSLDLSNFDTSNVTNMGYIFRDCQSLTSLDVSSFDTSNVTNIRSMFSGCNKLTSLDLSNFDTSNVTDMGYIFRDCQSLTSLDVSSFVTTNVTSMSLMFYGCNKLTSLDLSNFDTSNVTNMGYMFYDCKALTSLDVSNFDTSKVTDMGYMFQNCSKLTSLDLSNFNTSNVTDMEYMFNGCSALMYLNVTGWPLTDYTQTAISTLPVGDDAKNEIEATVYFTVPSGWTLINPLEFLIYTANASGVLPTFNTAFTGYSVNETDNGDGTYSVKIATDSLDNLPTSISFLNKTNLLTIERISTSEVTNMAYMFQNCSNLTSLDLSNFDTTNVTNMSYMFQNCTALTSLDLSNFNTTNVTNMYMMFYGCNALTSLDLSNFDTTNVTNTNSMFRDCSALTSLDLSNFDTTNVTNMSGMFRGCSALTSLDVTSFVTTNVKDMNSMFYQCKALTSLDLSSFNTSKVTLMYDMFYQCNALTSLDVSNFDTSNVTSMENMFRECGELTSLDVSGFDTTNVTNMSRMFNYCSKLTSLDLSSFDTSKVTLMNSMFYQCIALTSLDSMQNIGVSLSLSSTILDITSLLDVIDNLITVTTTSKTLTLGSTLLAKLTEEQIAVVTNKGWTVQ